jgi:hypothetical protein
MMGIGSGFKVMGSYSVVLFVVVDADRIFSLLTDVQIVIDCFEFLAAQ